MTSELHCACTLLVLQLISQSDNFYVFCLCVVFVFCTFCNDLRSASCLRASSKLQHISPSDNFYDSPEIQWKCAESRATSHWVLSSQSFRTVCQNLSSLNRGSKWQSTSSIARTRSWPHRDPIVLQHQHERGCGVTEKETLGPYPVPQISAVYAMVRDNCVYQCTKSKPLLTQHCSCLRCGVMEKETLRLLDSPGR